MSGEVKGGLLGNWVSEASIPRHCITSYLSLSSYFLLLSSRLFLPVSQVRHYLSISVLTQCALQSMLLSHILNT